MAEKIDTPKNLNLYLHTKLPLEIAEQVEFPLAFLFNNPNCPEFSKLLKQTKHEMKTNFKLLIQFLGCCNCHDVKEEIEELLDTDLGFKAYDEKAYEDVKQKLDKPKSDNIPLSQQHLELRLLLVQFLAFPDPVYTDLDRDMLKSHFKLDKKVEKSCNSLLELYFRKELKDFDDKNNWGTFKVLIWSLNYIGRKDEATRLENFQTDHYPAKSEK